MRVYNLKNYFLISQPKYILKEKRNATGGNIIFVWLDDSEMKSLLEMSN